MMYAKLLQNLLNDAGYKTLAAGGCVRDFLLTIEPKDIDLATEALPEQIIEVLNKNNIKTIETGLKHGTITAVVNKNNYEITTLRLDRNCDGRHAEVEFIKSFEEDAKRRDLTINALFMDLNTYEIIDYVGGREDLNNKVLRFVGDPEKRIKEDFLRLLRFFRFASKLNFNLDQKSLFACKKYLPYLSYISCERIREEFSKLLMGEGVYDVLMEHPDMVFTVFPEMLPTFKFNQNCDHHIYDVYTHSIKSVKYVRGLGSINLSFAAFFHDIAKPLCYSIDPVSGKDHFYNHEDEGERIADKICYRLKFSDQDTKKIKFLIKNHMRFNNNLGISALRRFINDCADFGDKMVIMDLFSLNRADCYGMKEDDKDFKELSEKIDKCLEDLSQPKIDSPISGKEIMDTFNISEGKKVGIIKNYLKNLVIEGSLDQNDKETAIKLVSEYIVTL